MKKVAEIFNVIAPVKSALSQYRQKISYLFFKEIFDLIAQGFHEEMKTYKGYHIVGFDGDDLNLPPSKDILEEGYRGYKIDDKHETHYLKMYLVKCVDLLSNVVLDFRQAVKNDEIGLAVQMLSCLPKKTIALYDRLYFSKRIINSHVEAGLFFVARCKSGKTFKEVIDFFNSNKTQSFYFYTDKKTNTTVKISLIKILNPRNGKPIVIATNLDISDWTNEEIATLYTLRWDCESNNRDSTSTLKLDQWHSMFFNGIMQEIYVHLIMMNFTKINIFKEGGYKIDLKENETQKANFKFIFYVIFDLIPSALKKKINHIVNKVRDGIRRTVEKRKRLSRCYPRQTKKRGKSYANASIVKLRPLN